jgi:hypothetical protein
MSLHRAEETADVVRLKMLKWKLSLSASGRPAGWQESLEGKRGHRSAKVERLFHWLCR